jgi:hypothetical protein
MAINVKDAEEKLGKEKIKEIAEKDWKVTEVPSEEELAKKESTSPKARNNPNSRANLMQHRKKTPEQKVKSLKNLKFVEKEEDIVPRDILGDYADILAIEKLMPALDVLANRKEQEVYYNYIYLILQDFDVDELTSSDIDDIITLALNRVIEYRLLKGGAKNPMLILEAAPTIEKFRKFSEKIKSSLASRRVDRIDVKNRPAFSIVDLATSLDDAEKADYERRIRELEADSASYIAPVRNDEGYVMPDDEVDDG